jgi:alkanesulfonate monooxygenase SsuD/methylene tetrahydromethanopterin reductase-like flavin-dependent oxidoreductase (luciferase family)
MVLAPSSPSLAIQGGSVALVVEAGVAAERSGFSSIWTTELYNRSAVVTLAALASATSRIGLGSGIAWAFGRSPLTLATDARSIDELSGGRLALGVGTGSPVSMAECHLPPDPSIIPLTHGTMPVLMAGVQPPMLRAAGAVSDGLVGHPLFTRSYVEEVVRPALAEGAARTSRDTGIPIAGMIICAISDDPAEARRGAAMQIAAYAVRRASDPMLDFNGFTAETAKIREAFGRRDFPAMIAAVSDKMLETTAVYGTRAEAIDQYRQRWESLYETPLLYTPNTGLSAEYMRDNISAICDTFATVAA